VGCPINSDEQTGAGVFMDPAFFKSIIDRIDFKTVVIPWMNGEPLMHPRIAELFAYISAAGHPWYVTTNGHFWNDAVFEHITDGDSTCYQVIVSIDGLPGSESITGARPGSNPRKVVETIGRLLELKNRKGSSVDIAVKAVQRGQDWGELEEYTLYWLDQGVDYVCIGRMLEQETSVPMRREPCQYFDNNFMVIRHDGELVLCAYNDRVVNDGENPVATLDATTPLLEAYNAHAYQRYRDMQNRGVYPGPCENCGFAYTGQGLTGEVAFRRDPGKRIYYRNDYYNTMMSYKDRGKSAAYYEQGATAETAGTYYRKEA
jgi:MoaA/NifB/PqqE/SkfB family radical SAM enzyme